MDNNPTNSNIDTLLQVNGFGMAWEEASISESETYDSEDLSESEGDDTTWIQWFCNLRGNEFFCEVDEDYIQDDFNLSGLSQHVNRYEYALEMILD